LSASGDRVGGTGQERDSVVREGENEMGREIGQAPFENPDARPCI